MFGGAPDEALQWQQEQAQQAYEWHLQEAQQAQQWLEGVGDIGILSHELKPDGMAGAANPVVLGEGDSIEEYDAHQHDEALAIEEHERDQQHSADVEAESERDLARFVECSVSEEVDQLRKQMRQMRHTDSEPWHGPVVGVQTAPWCVFLSPDWWRPFWGPRDMLLLRSVCCDLRDDQPTAAFFAARLASLGVRLRWQCHSPRALFELCVELFDELCFVRALPPSACVVGSHALHRLQLLSLGIDPGFRPNDLDVYVVSQEDTSLRELPALRRRCAENSIQFSTADTPSALLAKLAVAQVIDLASGFMARERWVGAHHDPRIQQRAMVEVQVHGENPDYAFGEEATRPYPKERLVEALDYLSQNGVWQQGGFGGHTVVPNSQGWMASWAPQLDALPDEMGMPRPYRLVRVGYVKRLGPAVQGGPGFAGWSTVRAINVIEVRGAGEHALTPLGIVDAFDMEQCKVVMRVDAALRPLFEHSELTRQCALLKLIRFTRHAAVPACGKLVRGLSQDDIDGTEAEWVDFLLEIAKKMYFRARKYEDHGFSMCRGQGS